MPTRVSVDTTETITIIAVEVFGSGSGVGVGGGGVGDGGGISQSATMQSIRGGSGMLGHHGFPQSQTLK